MMWLFMEAEDVLLFRDGRPFNAGSDHQARSLFPPSPSVMQGVIRSHYLLIKNIPLSNRGAIKELVGDTEDYKALRLRGPWLARQTGDGRVVRYFPTPTDAYPADENAERILPMKVVRNPGGNVWAGELPYLLEKPNEIITKNAPGAFVSEEDLMSYLEKGVSVRTEKADALYVSEVRLGIQTDSRRRSTVEGMLYEVEFIRPQAGTGLYLEMDGYPDFPKEGLLRAGGEGRALHYKTLRDSQISPIRWGYSEELPRFFKVYFATPAYFSQGWKPDSWTKFFTREVRLEAVALSRYQVLGGFDYWNHKQKPSRRLVPAGSVYYFSHSGGARLRQDLVQQAITEWGAEIGFGQVLVAGWKPVE